MRLKLFLGNPCFRQVIEVNKQVIPNTINNNKPILTVRIIKFQSPPVSIILKQLLRLRVGIRFLLRLLIVRIVVHVVIVRVFRGIVLAHLVARVHIWIVVIVSRHLSILLRMDYIICRRDVLSILRAIFVWCLLLLFFQNLLLHLDRLNLWHLLRCLCYFLYVILVALKTGIYIYNFLNCLFRIFNIFCLFLNYGILNFSF